MTRARVLAAVTGIVTAVLLQATLVGPAFAPLAVSLPAVLVAAVALVDGPAAGMSFGFAAGLVADLASRHPAGVLALCWLGAGLLCGTLADRRSLRKDALTAGVVSALATAAGTLLLTVVHQGGTALDAARNLLPGILIGTLLAFPLVALVRRMLRSDSLHAPHPVYTELAVGGGRD